MMILAWVRSMSGVYPVLYYTQLPTKGEGEPDSLNRILQHHTLTPEQEAELDRMPDGVSRVDAAAKTFPYNSTDTTTDPVDTVLTMREVLGAVDDAVYAYRQRMRKYDGQTAQIDKENGTNV